MRALITGVAGQDGTLLSAALVKNGWEVFGTHLASEVTPTSHSLHNGNLTALDITNHVEVLRPITPTKDGLINTFTLNNRTYIPTNIIPKAYTPIFNNKKVPVNETTLKNTVIKVNDKFYSPVVDKEWKTLTVG
jgi:hypothetical protein